MFERKERNGGTVLQIKGTMSVFNIAKTHKEIVASFDACEDLALDLKGVTDCDISGLQLIYSARKTANSIGKAFSVEGASRAIIDIFNRAGLSPETVLAKKTKIQNAENGEEVSNGQGHHDG
jgi:anti-anti-sigma factor